MHNKFAIFDKLNRRDVSPRRVASNVVFQTSANFNPYGSGDGMWNNSVTAANNTGLYTSYSTYFSLLAKRASITDLYGRRAELQDVNGAITPTYFPEKERPKPTPEEPGDEIVRILNGELRPLPRPG